jgi:hypothetical protein
MAEAASGPSDQAVTAFLQAIPAERRQELRSLVRAARARDHDSNRRDAAIDAELMGDLARDEYDDEEVAMTHPAPATSGLPLPAMDPEMARRTADLIMLETMRQAGREVTRAAVRPPAAPPRARVADTAPEPLSFVVRLSAIQPQALRWLSPGRLAAGKITVLDGDPGLGKSTLLCEPTTTCTTPPDPASTPRAAIRSASSRCSPCRTAPPLGGPS